MGLGVFGGFGRFAVGGFGLRRGIVDVLNHLQRGSRLGFASGYNSGIRDALGGGLATLRFDIQISLQPWIQATLALQQYRLANCSVVSGSRFAGVHQQVDKAFQQSSRFCAFNHSVGPLDGEPYSQANPPTEYDAEDDIDQNVSGEARLYLATNLGR